MKTSYLIIPFSIVVHLFIINSFLYLLTKELYLDSFNLLYLNVAWLVITFSFNYYPTKRKEEFFTNFHQVIQIFVIYLLAFFAMLGFNRVNTYSLSHIALAFSFIYALIIVYRAYFYWARSLYRTIGGNSSNVIVIGRDKNLKKLRNVFDEPNLGYRYEGYFDNKPSPSKTYLGEIKDAFNYIKNNNIDQVYCMVSKLSKTELQQIIDFCDNNLKRLKIIPDNKEMFYTRSMNIELYDSVPVLTARQSPMEAEFSLILKRAFDIVFSLIVIIGVLSWLAPLIYLIMKLTGDHGSLIFSQTRNGLERKDFSCYKFRSMRVNKESNTKMVSKNDSRITKLGSFLRKTSLDELPQFINVLLGDMSVVGPRPHMETETIRYENSIDKYLVRHYVKPGVTGLAQIKGYRGEIVKQTDIVNRVRLDIFYLEKWTMYLDMFIIYSTVMNIFKGEEKAY